MNEVTIIASCSSASLMSLRSLALTCRATIEQGRE